MSFLLPERLKTQNFKMQNQKLKQLQKLKISSKQIQFLNLLQTPVTDLEREIEKVLEENPALEEVEETEEENTESTYFHQKENNLAQNYLYLLTGFWDFCEFHPIHL